MDPFAMIIALGYQRPFCRPSSFTFSCQSFVGPPGQYSLTPNVEVKDQPPMLICLPASSGKVRPAEQKTSVLRPFIVRQACAKLLTLETSSSKAPVELAAKLVPFFSRKVTLPVTVCEVMRGTTTPPISNWYEPAPLPVGVRHVYKGVPVHLYRLRRPPAPQRYLGSPEQGMLHPVSVCLVDFALVTSTGSPQSDCLDQ